MTRAKSVNSSGTGTYEFLLKTRMLTKNAAHSRIFHYFEQHTGIFILTAWIQILESMS